MAEGSATAEGSLGPGGPAGALGAARAAHWRAAGREAGALAHPGGPPPAAAGGAGAGAAAAAAGPREALALAEAAAAWGAGRVRGASEADDLPTGVLPFLLAPFHVAALAAEEEVLAARGGAGAGAADPRADERRQELRAAGLREAAAWADRGLEALAALGLAGGVDIGEGEDGPGGASRAEEDPAKRRERKLRERRRLGELRRRTGALEERRAQALALGVCAGQEDVSLGEWLEELAGVPRGGWGEEDERALWLQLAEAQALEAGAAALLARQEADMLRSAPPGNSAAGRLDPRAAPLAPAAARGTVTVNDNAELQRAMARMLGGDRARLQEGVFRPTVALPTMTVEQFGVQERERMLEREAKQREAEAEKAAVRAAKEDRAEDESEEDLQKQRAWDDWKDDHPYGSGNSRLRPCA